LTGGDFADFEKILECFHGLKGADDAGEGSKDSRFSTVGNGVWGRRFGEEATIARLIGKMAFEDGDLSVELEDGAVDERFFKKKSEVVGEITSGKIIATIEDEVIFLRDRLGIFRGETNGEFVNLDIRVESAQAFGGSGDFGLTNLGVGEKDLTL